MALFRIESSRFNFGALVSTNSYSSFVSWRSGKGATLCTWYHRSWHTTASYQIIKRCWWKRTIKSNCTGIIYGIRALKIGGNISCLVMVPMRDIGRPVRLLWLPVSDHGLELIFFKVMDGLRPGCSAFWLQFVIPHLRRVWKINKGI